MLKAMAAALRGADAAGLKPLLQFGNTPVQIIESLVQLPDSKGLTALHLACIKGHADAAEVLMELGANPFMMVRVSAAAL